MLTTVDNDKQLGEPNASLLIEHLAKDLAYQTPLVSRIIPYKCLGQRKETLYNTSSVAY